MNTQTTLENTTYRLVEVFDLRLWDPDLECWIPIDDDMKSICSKCGRKHAKVYRVQRLEDGEMFDVGSGCSKKHLDGWQPEKEELKKLEKAAQNLAKNKAHQKLVDIATPIAEEVKALEVPPIVFIETKHLTSQDVPVYGMENSRVRVWCREGLTEERKNCCISGWKHEQITQRLEALYPPTAELVMEDKNHKRRWNLEKIIRNELNVW